MANSRNLDRVKQDFPHLRFTRCWKITEAIARKIGQCESLVRCIGDLPIEPGVQDELRRVSLERGAVATTAIEGNTLTEAELRRRLAGHELPESRRYQAQEVTNVLELMTEVRDQVVNQGFKAPISTELLREFNKKIGRELGPLYDGVPGRLRRDGRHVGAYVAPPYESVPDLTKEYCEWLKQEFRFHDENQSFADAVVQSIVAHVFFEWIHPFADGNGRTGRLIEFYILLRAGMPDVAAHILANHYNDSRSEYAAHFDKARKRRDLTEFLSYAITGLVDGLWRMWEKIHENTFKVCWEAHVYRVFSGYDNYHKRSIFKRRRTLALAMPIGKAFTLMDLARSSNELAGEYMEKNMRTIKADFDVVRELGLAESTGVSGEFIAKSEGLRTQHLARRARVAAASDPK